MDSFWTDRRVFVTGATGFVAARWVRRLLEAGATVCGTVRAQSNDWRVRDLASLQRVEVDLRDTQDITDAVQSFKPEFVYHLAAYGVHRQHQDDREICEANALGTLNLYKALADCSQVPQAIIHSGSCFEYGMRSAAVSEQDVPKPATAYAVSKVAATLLGQCYACSLHLPITTLRLFSVYGPAEGGHRLIAGAIHQFLKNQDMAFTSGHQQRDFIYIDDVLDAFEAAAKSTLAHGEIVNIGTGRAYSIRQVVESIAELTATSVTPTFGKLFQREDESQCLVADVRQAQKCLGWTAKTTLTDGLAETVKWFRKNATLVARHYPDAQRTYA